MTRPPSFSFRNLPPAIYLGYGLGLASSFTLLLAFLALGKDYSSKTIFYLFAIDGAASHAQVLLISLGIFALARRYSGGARTLAFLGGWLLLVQLSWVFYNLLVGLAEPSGRDGFERMNRLFGAGVSLISLGGFIVLTIAADAWRRVPVAAALLVLVFATGHWVPGIGDAIKDLLPEDYVVTRGYYFVRELVTAGSWLFVLAALAAGGRDPAPDVRAASSGFMLARTALFIRLLAACVLLFVSFAGAGFAAGVVSFVIAPVVLVATTILFAVGLARAASSGLPEMPKWRLSIGAIGTVWWSALQIEHVLEIVVAFVKKRDLEDVVEDLQKFSLIGPIVTAVGLVLIAIAIASFERKRGAYSQTAQNRAITFVILAVSTIAIQLLVLKTTSMGGVLMLGLLAACTSIASVIVLMGLLRAASMIAEEGPGQLPPARIVSGS